MTRRFRPLLLLLLIGLLPAGPARAQVLNEPPARHVPGEILLKFRDQAKSADKLRVLDGLGALPVARPDGGEPRRYRLKDLTVEEAVARFGHDPALLYLEPNYVWTLSTTPNDPGFPDQWALHNIGQDGGLAGADIGAVEAWDQVTDSRTVLVGVVDSGIDYLHQDLVGNLWTNPGEIAGNGLDDDGNGFVDDVHGYDFAEGDGDPYDENGHGTHVAGTIAARGSNRIGVAGVNWRASLVALRALDADGEGTTESIVQAIEYGCALGVRVLNNSYGGTQYSAALYDAVTTAEHAGVLFVAAAGNSRQNIEYIPFYPACYGQDNIVSVAASDRHDALAATLSWGSNYGAVSVDLLAPGDQILSLLPGDRYGVANGTSMAAPHVSGALALMLALRPYLTVAEAKQALLDGATVLPQLAGTCRTGGRLSLPPIVAAADTIPPPPVTDLAATAIDGDRVTLAWTAVDDGGQPAASYDLRYSPTPLDEENWATGTGVRAVPEPAPGGSTESVTIEGLQFASTYYFGLRTVDGAGNAGAPALLPALVTLAAPVAVLDPSAISAELGSGVQETRTVQLRNEGQGSLRFDFGTPELGAPERSDGAGHVWIGSDDEGGPSYVWDEILGSGTLALTGQDEMLAGPFELGFEFPFYDRVFSRLWISSNGFVVFAVTAPSALNRPLPSDQAPSYLIAPFWADLDPGAGGAAFYEVRPDRMIVEFIGMTRRLASGPHTFQVHLLPDGTIEFYYQTLQQPGAPVTVGMQGVAGGPGLQIVYDEDFLHDGQALRIAKIPPWLTVEPTTGEVPGGGALDLAFRLDAADLCGPEFTASVPLTTNDPAWPAAEVPVSVSVAGQPHLALETLALDFGRVAPGDIATREIRLRNSGCAELTIDEITTGAATVAVAPTTLALAPGSGAILQVQYAPMQPEILTAELVLHSDDPEQPQRAIPLAAVAAEPPALRLTATSVTDTLRVGQQVRHRLPVGNDGGSPLELVAAADAAWFTVEPDTMLVAPGAVDTLWVTLDADALCGEQVEAPLRLATNDPLIPTATLPIRLRVESGSRLALPAGPLDWGAVYLGERATRTVVLANTGCEELNVLGLATGDVQYSVTDTSFALQPGQARSIILIFSPTEVGSRTADLLVASDDPAGRFARLELAGVGLAPPRLVVEPLPLRLDAAPLQTTTGELTIRNAGSDTLRVTATTTSGWLTAPAGLLSVPAGSSATLTLQVDATGLCGQTLIDMVTLETNDPQATTFAVPVVLTVTTAPAVVAEPDTLTLADLYVGQTATAVLTVTNRGCLAVEWGPISLPDPDLRLVGDLGRLEPGRRRDWELRWTPTTAGRLDGSLRLPSNDPDDPEITIVVRGEAREAPRATVGADGLDALLLTGAQARGRIDLRNDGGSELSWTLTTEPGAAPAGAAGAPVIAVGRPLSAWELAGLRDEGIALQRALEETAPLDRFAEPQSGEAEIGPDSATEAEVETFGAMQVRYSGDNRTRGNLFHCTTATTLREHRFYLEAPTATQMWMLVYEGDAPSGDYELIGASDLSPAGPGEGWFSSGQIDLPLQADRYYLLLASFSTTCGYYTAEDIEEYPVPASFGELILGAGYDWSPVTTFPPRDRQYVTGPFDRPVAYYQQVLTGEGTRWIGIEPRTGRLAPGASVEVDVVLDATGLCEAQYDARLRIATNDPERPQIELPSSVAVRAAPDLALSTARLDFGSTYPETPVDRPLLLTNAGCDVLSGRMTVTGSAAFQLREGAFELEPGASHELSVRFDPDGVADYSGTLTITSNDPDGAVRTVELYGQSRPAPVLIGNPTALVDTVQWGVLMTVPLQLTNEGGSPLDFQIVIDPKLPATQSGSTQKMSEQKQAAAGLGRILVMESDTGQRYYRQALQNLGLYHTFTTSYVGLGEAMAGGQYWNLVIVNNYADFPDIAAIDGLTAYVSSGRALILSDWVFGDYSNQAIATRMGVDFEANLFEPDDFRSDDPLQGLFTFPNAIDSWSWTDNQGVRDGQIVVPTEGATALAGYRDYPGAAAIIQNAERNSLFNAFQPVNFNADSDGDGKLDMVELCENQILYLVHQLNWLKVTPGSGTIAPGESLELQVAYDGSQILGGWLEADLRLLTNDPLRREVRVPVTLGLEGVSPVDDPDLPRRFALADAAPNPFNPSTTIAFDLPRAAHVQLKIYDVRGSLVATLLEEERPAGRHSVVWNGRDHADRAVASGVYFSRIQAGQWHATRRMTLLK